MYTSARATAAFETPLISKVFESGFWLNQASASCEWAVLSLSVLAGFEMTKNSQQSLVDLKHGGGILVQDAGIVGVVDHLGQMSQDRCGGGRSEDLISPVEGVGRWVFDDELETLV
jgi:hypothetical protein